MGCGKSTVGRALAEELGWRFIDLDEEIEKQENCTIAHIFETRGEPAFRLIETAALRQITRAIDTGRPYVVAVGGGAFLQEQNFELISNKGVSIWLDAPFERIQKRIEGQDHRPLARDPEKFHALYEARRAAYARAEYHVEIADDDEAHAVAQIQGLGLI
jgi:shikimate kinase